MNVMYIIVIIIPLIFLLWANMSSAYFPENKKEKQNLRKYVKYKGICYGVLILFTVVYDYFIKENDSPTLFVTLCIACFEMCQCIVQAKADEYNNRVMEEMKYNKEASEENIVIQGDHLKKFAIQKIALLYEHVQSDYFTQPIYEELKDYFKYYSSANAFLNMVKNFINIPKKYSKEELERELNSCIDNIVCYEIQIVKMPEKW